MAQAQTKPVVTSLGPSRADVAIFIGNSYFYYNGGMPRHVGLLEEAADPEHKLDYRNVLVAFGGYHLSLHNVESYFRSNAHYRYGDYMLGNENGASLGPFDERFDVAVMMDCSRCPIDPELRLAFTESAKKGQCNRPRPWCTAGAFHVVGLC